MPRLPPSSSPWLRRGSRRRSAAPAAGISTGESAKLRRDSAGENSFSRCRRGAIYPEFHGFFLLGFDVKNIFVLVGKDSLCWKLQILIRICVTFQVFCMVFYCFY